MSYGVTQPDYRGERVYRRGLVLGLTIAEVMILLMFILLMALAVALANRDEKIKALDHGGASRLIDEMQRAFPNANPDDYFKELRLALDARKTLEQVAPEDARETLLADAKLGQAAREMMPGTTPDNARETFLNDAKIGKVARDAAARAGAQDPVRYAIDAMGSKRGQNAGLPFFSLSEAGGFYFDSGKATLRPEFDRSLRAEIIPRLAQMVRDYDVHVVEVIGHTDEVRMWGKTNLDSLLIAASAGRAEIGALQSTDNAGLAIARAVSVVKVLRADARLRGVTILPLSAAQMIVPIDRPADGTSRGDDQSRRRIEIRLRERSGNQERAQVRPTG